MRKIGLLAKTLIPCFTSPRRFRSLVNLCRSISYWKDNPEPTQEDLEITARIIAAYQQQAANPRAKKPDRTGIWEDLAYRNKIRYWKLIERRETYGLASLLASFKRNPGALGINPLGPFLLSRWGLRENCIYVNTAYERFATVEKLRQENRLLTELSSSNCIGNPYIVDIEGEEVDRALLLYQEVAHEMLSLLEMDFSAKNLFLEIGGGFGGLEGMLMRMFDWSTFAIVDLPEILIFPMYYLSRMYPEKRLAYYAGEGNLQDIIDQNDVVLIPDWAASDIPDKSVDVVINRNSLENIPRPIGLGYALMTTRILKRGGALFSKELWEDDPRAREGNEGNGILNLLMESGALESFEKPRFIASPAARPPQVFRAATFRLR